MVADDIWYDDKVGEPFSEFVKALYQRFSDGKIDFLQLTKQDRHRLKEYAKWRGTNKNDLLRSVNFEVVNSDRVYGDYDELLQARFDEVFIPLGKKDGKAFDLDEYALKNSFPKLYETTYNYVTTLNDRSYAERQKGGIAGITLSEYISTHLVGYSSTKYQTPGKEPWLERAVQENLAIKHFGANMDTWAVENGYDNRLMGELSSSQWQKTSANAGRLAVREGYAEDGGVSKLYKRLGVPIKGAHVKSHIKKSMVSVERV